MLDTFISTVARLRNLLGLVRLRNFELKHFVQRYEPETPGDLIQIDVTKLARFCKVGSRIPETGLLYRGRLLPYARAFNNFTPLAYVGVLVDEQQSTAID